MRLALILSLAPFGVGVSGQPTSQSSAGANLAFEVASIKPHKADGGPFLRGFSAPADRFEATNMPLKELIKVAWGDSAMSPRPLPEYRITGGPAWIANDAFDINAKAPSSTSGPVGWNEKRLMLQTLLTERFKLAVHHETRDGPMYALVLARSDGRLGPELHKTELNCEALMAARQRGGAPLPTPQPGQRPPCALNAGMNSMVVGGQAMSTVVNFMSILMNRVVEDRTGLSGFFDFELRFSSEGLPGLLPPPPGVPQPPANNDLPSIFTALQEQLGLKLDSTRGPVDLVVVDHAEQPTPD